MLGRLSNLKELGLLSHALLVESPLLLDLGRPLGHLIHQAIHYTGPWPCTHNPAAAMQQSLENGNGGLLAQVIMMAIITVEHSTSTRDWTI